MMAKKASKRAKKKAPATPSILGAWSEISKLQEEGIDFWALLDEVNGKAPREKDASISLRRHTADGIAPYVTKNQIEGKPADEVAEFLFQRVLDIFESLQSVDYNVPAMMKQIPLHWRAIYTVCWLGAEVDNGGHEQFFSNGGVEYAEEVVQDLRLINVGTFLKLFVEAWKLFDPNLTEVNPKMEPIDDAFYAQKKSLHTIVGEYVLAHMKDYCADVV